MRTFSSSLSFLLLPPLLAVLAGCGDYGAAGNATVSQGCAGSTLPCQSASDFNAPLAIGASVPLSVDLTVQGGGQPPLTLISSDPSVFTVAQQTLTGVGPGIATLLLEAEDSVVVDFVAVWVQQPFGLTVSRLSAEGTDLGEVPGTVGLLVGDTVPVAVGAVSNTEALAGSAEVTWSVADPTVVSVLDDGIVGRGNVVGRAGGRTTVTASALGLQTSFSVEVTP